MGSNMQRCQAVRSSLPRRSSAPVSRPSWPATRRLILAKRDGVVGVGRRRPHRREPRDEGGRSRIYRLSKFQRSNQSTCYARSPSSRRATRSRSVTSSPTARHDMGELALGRNVVVAFMPWDGLQLRGLDPHQRAHRRRTTSSPRSTSRSSSASPATPNSARRITATSRTSAKALKGPRRAGIVRIGAEVQAGDILVGKITPKGETQLPEEKLLRAIFGEKASDVRDSSLRVPPGVGGVVINAQASSRARAPEGRPRSRIEDAGARQARRTARMKIKIIHRLGHRACGSSLTGR